MSFQIGKEDDLPAARSKPQLNMSPSPAQLALYQQYPSQQLPYEPNTGTMLEHGLGHLNSPLDGSNPRLIAPPAPMPGSDPRYLPSYSSYDQSPPGQIQAQPTSALETQLRNMILSNEAHSGHQRTSSVHATITGPSPQSSMQSPHSISKWQNQAQKEQQAQQMQVPFQYTPTATGTAIGRHSELQQNHGPRPLDGTFATHQQTTLTQPWRNANQRLPYDSLPQTRSLFEPHSGISAGRGGSRGPRTLGVDNQAQLSYIDHLAGLKIPEVQISPEEFSNKLKLKSKLNDICRKVILDHELQSNPKFTRESVELKSFGSLSIGFATKESDMDLVLVSPESKPALSSPESDLPRMVERTLMEMGFGARLLTQTRVPIIKFCEKPSPELAAHLRLTRLRWEMESEAHTRRAGTDAPKKDAPASSEQPGFAGTQANLDNSLERENASVQRKLSDSARSSQIATAVAPEASSNSMLQDLSDLSNVSNLEAGLVSAPAKNNGNKKTERVPERLENDPSWLPKLSDYELIGLFTMALKDNTCEPHQRSIILASLEVLETQDANENPRDVDKARKTLRNMPNVIKKCRTPSREDLEIPKSGVGTQCDINFSNQLALHNSLLLKCYSLCDPRVRQMVLFVKAWTKIRKINSPYHGTLNSYGYVLMVLHFLMNVAQPPIVPNLQLATDMIQRDSLSANETSFDGYNIQFFRNEAVIEDMAQRGVFGQNTESLGSLLRSFFQFYANPPYGTFSWKDDVLSLRTKGGILTKKGKGWVGARTEMVDLAGPGPGQKKVNHHYVVAIEDPFETEHNVARTVFFNGVVAIRDEFRRAADLISFAGIDPRLGPQDFFAEGKKNENLQLRSGPPRKDNAQKKGNVLGKETAPREKTGSGTGSEPAKDTALPTRPANQKEIDASKATISRERIAEAKASANRRSDLPAGPSRETVGERGGAIRSDILPPKSSKKTAAAEQEHGLPPRRGRNIAVPNRNTSRKAPEPRND